MCCFTKKAKPAKNRILSDLRKVDKSMLRCLAKLVAAKAGDTIHFGVYCAEITPLADEPAAMLIPHHVKPDHGIQLVNMGWGGGRRFMDVIEEQLEPANRSGAKLPPTRAMGMDRVQNVGLCTVLVASSILKVQELAKQMPENRRFKISDAQVAAIYAARGDMPFTVWGYDPKEMRSGVQSAGYVYVPNENTYMFPALDDHDGTGPNMQEMVSRDAKLFWGTSYYDGAGQQVSLNSLRLPTVVTHGMSTCMTSKTIKGNTSNGDWYFNPAHQESGVYIA